MQSAQINLQIELRHLRCEVRDLRVKNARKDRSLKQLRTLKEELKRENQKLKKINKNLKEENVKLIQNQEKQAAQLESLELIVEELRRVIFGKGKKRKKKEGESGEDGNNGESSGSKGRKKANRSKDSYRRPIPNESEITTTFKYSLAHCPDCGTRLEKLKEIVRYLEDLKDLSQLHKLVKSVEKHIITTGYCPKCKIRKSAREISPQLCSLGEEVKKFIVYSIIIQRQSFEQVQRFLWDLVKLKVSDGEIAISLEEQAGKLTLKKDQLLNKIRGDPGRHYDETSWKVQSGGQGDYAWVTIGTQNKEAVFLVGRSRGQGNARNLKGPVDNQVGITDDYSAYRKLFKKHQLCWAHPKRKMRDLKNSNSLAKPKRKLCSKSYQEFSKLYRELESTLATEYNQTKWLQKKEEYLARLKILAKADPDEPLKLQEIKRGLKINAEKYFTCLLEPGIPADNNKAERALRHLVLKRKMSYGSKSQKGADTMGILFSVLLSMWWSKPDNFFKEYDQMLSC